MTASTATAEAAPSTLPPDQHAVDNPHHARRWWILVILSLAQLMVVLDTTIVNIALPDAQSDLGFNDSQRQWIVTAYALAFGSLLLLGGRLGDMFGRKWVFLIGLTGFAIASAIGGAAESFGMLVAARAVQGVFGALLAPAALSLLTTTFTEAKERAKAFGIFGAIAGGGAGVGLLLGGFLTEYLSWRWAMYVNLFFAVAALVGGMMFLVHRKEAERAKLDLPGAVTVSLALFALVFGFSHAETDGWGNGITVASLIAGVVLLAVFVQIERVVAHPILPLRVVLDRNRGGAYLAVLIVGLGMFGVFLFITYYLQVNLHFSPIQSGLAFLPMVGMIVVIASVGTAVLATRISPKWMISGGMLIAAIAMVMLTGISPDSSYVSAVLPGTMVMGAGMGILFASAMSTATMNVSADDAGVASASVNMGQQIGGSIGTSLLSTIAASGATAYVTSHAINAPAGSTADQIKALAGELQVAATIHGYQIAFWVAAAIFAAGAVITGLLLRPGIPVLDPEGAPTMMH